MALNDILSGIPILGGLFDDSDENQKANIDKVLDLYKNKKNYAKYTGGYDPELVEAERIAEDPAMKEAQMSYLGKLMRLGDEGLSEVDAAGFDKARREAEALSQRQQNTIINQMRERGVGGSGAELALRAQAAQGAANQAAASNLEQAADTARQRALYTQAYGSQLGNVRDQDYRAQAANQDAANRIAQFNANNMTGARQYEAQTKQDLEGSNKAARREGLTEAYGQQSDYYGAQNAQRRAQRGAIGKAVGSAIGAAAGGPAGSQLGGDIGAAAGNFFG